MFCPGDLPYELSPLPVTLPGTRAWRVECYSVSVCSLAEVAVPLVAAGFAWPEERDEAARRGLDPGKRHRAWHTRVFLASGWAVGGAEPGTL